MSAEREDWASAFLRQGASDLTVHELLAARDELPLCHALHYLQMACEKIAKAYRARNTNAKLHGEDGLLRRHRSRSSRRPWTRRPHRETPSTPGRLAMLSSFPASTPSQRCPCSAQQAGERS